MVLYMLPGRSAGRYLPACCLLLLSCFHLAGQSRVLYTLAVSSGPYARQDSPVSFALEGLPVEAEPSGYALSEIVGAQRFPVSFQMDQGQPVRIWWQLSGATPAGQLRVYELSALSQPVAQTDALSIRRKNGGALVEKDGKPLLQYQYEPVPVPEGKSELYRRSGFIHPLWSPKGAVLTRIQAPDHLHHYGIWNPWTHTVFEGRKVDFWNLGDGQGTVQVAAPPLLDAGPVYADIRSRHAHIDLTAPHPSGAKTALHENWQIRVWNSATAEGPRRIDFQSTLSCATDSALRIEAYRYQGFGFRATGQWNDQNAVLLSSEGKNKSDANGTRARWIDVHGPTEFGQSGILFMTHPLNHNFPEQLRVWPVGMNEGKENVFLNFNPAQEQDWLLKPGKTYQLQYGMVVYDGILKPETLERYWLDYAHPPAVRVLHRGWSGVKKVLVYTKNGKGYVHENRATAAEAIRQLGTANGFLVDISENPEDITEANLKNYQAVVLANTNNETFDTDAQKLAFQRYIQAGGGLVGIHSASGSERQWPWFWRTLGGKFRRHPPLQRFEIAVLDRLHPATLHLPAQWSWEDECYYLDQLNPEMHVLLAAELNTVKDDQKSEYPGTTFGHQLPLSWCLETGRGRSWYTALGHKPEYYSDPVFRQHLLGGIIWVLGGTGPLDYSGTTPVLITD